MLAASLLVGAFLGGGATWLLHSATHSGLPATQAADLVLSAHLRGLISAPTDVTSSEGHTVKPWFNGRIPRAPRVIDLSQAGFAEPVPTIVYRRRQHVISLTQLPAGNETQADPKRDDMNGFNRIGWTDRGVSYWAASDLNTAELGEFARLFRSAP